MPTFNICPCCGVEFGYEDMTIQDTKKYREKWICSGMGWFTPGENLKIGRGKNKKTNS